MSTDTSNTPLKKTTKVACPECNKKVEWKSENAYRPFCSERCKLLDLGAWANEEYQIPAEISSDEEDFSTGMIEMESYLARTNKPTIH